MYQVCYPDSLTCGSSVLFFVNETLSTTTSSEFFDENSLCYYTLQTFENNDQVTLNVTFDTITYANVYFVYKLVGDQNYT